MKRIFSAFTFLLFAASAAQAAERPNVLMIWVDDLRPEITAFGAEGMSTPNLDRLAARSVRFDRAYCNIPVCGASRASVMTGMRGTWDKYVDYDTRIDVETPGVESLNRHFKKAGYQTAGYGKIFHFGEDAADGWDDVNGYYEWPGYRNPENIELYKRRPKSQPNGVPWEMVDVEDNDLADGKIADAACAAMQGFVSKDQPFFLAAGFFKPHLPFVAPKKYWKPYNPSKMKLPKNFITSCNVPSFAFANWGELRSYYGMPTAGGVSQKDARHLIAAYKACVSFTDANVGRLLDQLDATGEADNTIIVLLGDHGWNLGEHGMWCKHCCFETSMRTPLLVSAPMLKGFQPGKATRSLTEFIDIYPTLCELTGTTPPEQLQGTSFTAELKDPSATHRETAIGRFVQSDTIRTDRFRYTIFRNNDRKEIGHMLFDHDNDPAENVNLADDPKFASVVEELRPQLMATFSE